MHTHGRVVFGAKVDFNIGNEVADDIVDFWIARGHNAMAASLGGPIFSDYWDFCYDPGHLLPVFYCPTLSVMDKPEPADSRGVFPCPRVFIFCRVLCAVTSTRASCIA